jgi:diguanylate cyclase (GGDEF)-like protein
MLDIDYFKRVNDTYGHMIGDQVLEQIAVRCRSVLRVSDMIGRYGGEEFVILLPETDTDSAYTIANRIRLLIMDRPIYTERGEISLTVSLGVASMTGDCDIRLEQVLDHADQALLRAKESGRNRICNWYDPYTKGSLFGPS